MEYGSDGKDKLAKVQARKGSRVEKKASIPMWRGNLPNLFYPALFFLGRTPWYGKNPTCLSIFLEAREGTF